MSHLDEERITALLDGELSDFEARQAREHIAACPECSARFEEMSGIFGEAERLVQVIQFPQSTTPAAPLPAVAVVTPARRPLPLRPLAWAASLLLAIGLGYYGNEFRLGRHQSELDDRAAAPTTMATADQVGPAESKADQPAATPPVPAPKSTPAPGERAEDAPRAKDESARRPAAPARALAAVPAPQSANEAAIDKEARAGLSTGGSVAQGKVTTPPVAGTQAKTALASGDRKAVDSIAAQMQARSEPSSTALMAGVTARQDAAVVPPGTLGFQPAAPVAAPVKVSMEKAVQALGGTIHLIDGMSPDRVEQLSPRAVSGAHAGLPVIRVIYLDAPMREIWLDQQRGLGRSAPRDTVLLWTEDGGQSLQWMTGTDDWLSLTGHLTADSLKALAQWVR
ncbi:MAG: zf-HC2 domain-containing protein [Gemmatimonadota bacterium]